MKKLRTVVVFSFTHNTHIMNQKKNQRQKLELPKNPINKDFPKKIRMMLDIGSEYKPTELSEVIFFA